MATFRVAPQLHPNLISRLEEARARTDALFELLPPNSFYERPVAERHRLIFYLNTSFIFSFSFFYFILCFMFYVLPPILTF